MIYLIVRILANAIAISLAVKLIDGITFAGQWWKMIVVGAVFGVVNALIRPIVKLFTFPLIILSLGLFTLIVNALMLGLTAYLSDAIGLGLAVAGFWPAFWGALVISVVSFLLSLVTGRGE